MQGTKFNLKWETYSDHLRDMLHALMISDELTDITLVSDDKESVRAHKIVLSACSSVFKDIIDELPQNNSVIYLRGIQHQEIESILQFMYLGVATINPDRMNEFLNVAKCLEIKEIKEKYADLVAENPAADDKHTTDNRNDTEQVTDSKENTKISDIQKIKKEIHEENLLRDNQEIYNKEKDNVQSSVNIENRHGQVNSDLEKNDGMFQCNHCEYQSSSTSNLKKHIRSIHEHDGMFQCNHCEYISGCTSNLRKHIRSMHEHVKYACNLCQYQATSQSSLKRHKQSIHEGVKYDCNQCNYQGTNQWLLKCHLKSKLEGVRYSCQYCGYKAQRQDKLKYHCRSKHNI